MVELWRRQALSWTLLALALALATLEVAALTLYRLDAGHQAPLSTLAFLTAASLVTSVLLATKRRTRAVHLARVAMCLLSSLLAAATTATSLRLLWPWPSPMAAGTQAALLGARLVLGLAATLAAAVACWTICRVERMETIKEVVKEQQEEQVDAGDEEVELVEEAGGDEVGLV